LRTIHDYKSRDEYSRYKWVNNKQYRKDILDDLNKTYGYNDFQYVLFCDGIASKYEKQIREYLEKEQIFIVTHGEILGWLFKNRNDEYTDNQILQLIRLINKHVSKLVEFK
jgi:hypothetical protein